MSEEQTEIWSEYFRIKNRLMDYDENLRDSISTIRMLMSLGKSHGYMIKYFAKAQKHVGLIFDLGLSCGAINNPSNEDINYINGIARGKWKSVEDFEKAQELFRKWYIETRFYNVSVQKDDRPAVIRKYGKIGRSSP